jgi:hypothetical protein
MNFSKIGINFYSENCIETARFYSNVLNIPILKESVEHSELFLSGNLSLYIDKPNHNCKVESGTLTFHVSDFNIIKIKEIFKEFILEYYSEKNQYVSFLDQYKNKIWIARL